MDWAGTASLLSAAYDGLVGFARRGGSEGTQIVPNLATSLPVITDGETRYAFQLRPGIRYSNGTLVKASDFLRAFERPFRGGSGREASRSSGLTLASGGRGGAISAGASGRTTRPGRSSSTSGGRDARLPADLVESGTDPARHAGPRSGDASGPVDRAVHDRELCAGTGTHARSQSLLPRVVERSPARTGSPTRSCSDCRPASSGVTAVERGQADFALILPRATQDSRRSRSRARYPSQVHVQPEQATVFLFLNTTTSSLRRRPGAARGQLCRRPCRHLRVVRRAGVRPGDVSAAPAGHRGFPALLPLHRRPEPDGRVEGARPHACAPPRRCSGTRGMSVTVWTYPGFWEPAARRRSRALKELGYRASIRRAENLDAYIAKTSDEKTRGVQAGMFGWYGVPRSAPRPFSIRSCTRSGPGELRQLLLRPAGGRPDRAGAESSRSPIRTPRWRCGRGSSASSST